MEHTQTESRLPSPAGPAFGGCLDISHGPELGAAQQLQLRLLALFAEYIVVPETFFHCYGPIYEHAKSFVDKKISVHSELVSEDLLLSLIRAGVIRPSLRSNARSILENFMNPQIEKGQFTYPDENEAKPVLRFLDELLQERTVPGFTRVNSMRPLRALKHLLRSPSPEDVSTTIANQLGMSLAKDSKWRTLLDEFHEGVVRHEPEGFFRRGLPEEALARALGLPKAKWGRVYYELASARSHQAHDEFKLARYLAAQLTVYYQAGYGTALGDVASISNYYAGHELDREAIGLATQDNSVSSQADWVAHGEPIDIGLLSSLHPRDLVELRRTAFEEYRDAMLKEAKRHHTFPDLVEGLVIASAEYRRAIAAKTTSKVFRAAGLVFCIGQDIASSAGLPVTIIGKLIDRASDVGRRLHDKEVAFRLGNTVNMFFRSME